MQLIVENRLIVESQNTFRSSQSEMNSWQAMNASLLSFCANGFLPFSIKKNGRQLYAYLSITDHSTDR